MRTLFTLNCSSEQITTLCGPTKSGLWASPASTSPGIGIGEPIPSSKMMWTTGALCFSWISLPNWQLTSTSCLLLSLGRVMVNTKTLPLFVPAQRVGVVTCSDEKQQLENYKQIIYYVLRLTMKVFSKARHLTMLLRASSTGLASTCLSTGLDKATEVPAADAGWELPMHNSLKKHDYTSLRQNTSPGAGNLEILVCLDWRSAESVPCAVSGTTLANSFWSSCALK